MEIIEEPDDVFRSKDDYNGRPVILFVKEINGETTVVTYDSKQSLDFRIQTMYSKYKKEA